MVFIILGNWELFKKVLLSSEFTIGSVSRSKFEKQQHKENQ